MHLISRVFVVAIALAMLFASGAAAAVGSPCTAQLTSKDGSKQELKKVAHNLDDAIYPFVVGEAKGGEVQMLQITDMVSIVQLPEQPKDRPLGLTGFEITLKDGNKRTLFINGITNLAGHTEAGNVRVPFKDIKEVLLTCP